MTTMTTGYRRTLTTGLSTIALCASVVGLAAPALAAAPHVTTGAPITVDGSFADWTATDFFAEMYRAGKADKPVESHLYLRFDCDAHVLYVGVKPVEDVTIIASDGDNFVKFGNTDKRVDGSDAPADGTQPNFAYAPNGEGWEASFSLEPGDYADLNVHAQVEDEGSQTSALIDRSIAISIACDAQSSQPESSQPESSQPESSQPESSQPESSQPESSQPESSQPESSQPESSQPESSQPESSQPEESTSGTSTEHPTPVESESPAMTAPESTSPEQTVAGSTGTPEQTVQGATGTPGSSMGDTAAKPAGRTTTGGAATWGLLLILSAGALVAAQRRRCEDVA